MGDPLDSFVNQLWHLVFTVFIPLIILGTLAAIVVRGGAKKLESAITRFLRGKPDSAPARRSPAARDEANAETNAAEAPCCPNCRQPMVLRKSRRGANAGSSFWGCPAYPNCRGTRVA